LEVSFLESRWRLRNDAVTRLQSLFRGRRGRQKSEAAAVMKQVREADEIAVRLEAGVEKKRERGEEVRSMKDSHPNPNPKP